MNVPNTEILVHITAPSRATDDANYRALASAYLAFEPVTRNQISLQDEPVSAIAAAETDTSQVLETQSATDFLRPSQREALLESPDVSFGSAADNLNSPDLRGARGSNRRVVDIQSSWHTPPSVIADSNPENNIAIPQYCSPTRILEHFLQAHETSQSELELSQALPRDASEGRCSQSISNEPGVLRQNINDTGNLTIVVPGSPPLSSRKRRRSITATPVSSEIEAIRSSFAAEGRNVLSPIPRSRNLNLHLSRTDSEPPLRKRQRSSPAKESSTVLARSSSDVGPRQERAKVQRLDGLLRARHGLDGLHIYSPSPPVSCDTVDPSTFVTETLAKLAKDLDIKKRFQPKEQRRELRPFERGYWLVDCTTWTDQLKAGAWGFLSNYVGNGVAGWGIWCCRDEEFRWIRLYCWGSVVGHMHLVLYLASQRKILHTGSTWVGANGEVVIVMSAKPTKSA